MKDKNSWQKGVKMMRFTDLIKIYEEKRKLYGSGVYKHISEILKEAKEIHYNYWLKHPTKRWDHEQSWRAWKGKNLEKLILYIIKEEVEALGLKLVDGNKLDWRFLV